MKWLRNFLFLIVLPIKFLSCSSGYKKIDGKWYYVSYDEGNWADKHNLDIDQNSFKVLDDKRFGKDSSKVFFEGKWMGRADPATFKIIAKDYSADDSQVYYKWVTLFGADPESFKTLKFPYSRDKKTVFCGNVPMNVDNIEQFRVTKSDPSYSIYPLEVFIKDNPEYSYLDSSVCKYVILGFGEAETRQSKYNGVKKIN